MPSIINYQLDHRAAHGSALNYESFTILTNISKHYQKCLQQKYEVMYLGVLPNKTQQVSYLELHNNMNISPHLGKLMSE